jgi:hypothetical protein
MADRIARLGCRRHPTLVTASTLRPLCALALSVLQLGTVACGPVEPVYDDDLGIQAVKVEEGELEGSFAVRSVSALLIDIPVPGFENTIGGRVTYRRVDRTWDPDAELYRQSSHICGGREFDVAGISTVIPQATFRAVPESTEETLRVDHDRGTYDVNDQVELWAIDLDQPLTDPLPEDDEAAALPEWEDRVYDMDEDGHPGFTTEYAGLLQARLFTVQRRMMTFTGVTQADGLALGTLRTHYDFTGLGGELDEPPPEPPPGPPPPQQEEEEDQGPFIQEHPDPKESWWMEVRIDESDSCDDIMQFEADGTFPRLRPF